MSTVLYSSPVFGPVESRRLGCSLGINLMPADGKVCTFDCVYCECGFNNARHARQRRPSRQEVSEALQAKLRQMTEAGRLPDVLTFAGNGEPTAHPDFAGIIDDTIALRNTWCPNAKVSVLSNATQLHRPDVVKALMQIENNIQKLDTVDQQYIRRIDRPTSKAYDVEEVIRQLKGFDGHVIIQTMFMQGSHEGIDVDNTGDEYVLPWLDALREIRPMQVMVYTVDRETPSPLLAKAAPPVLDAIAERVRAAGFPCSVSY